MRYAPLLTPKQKRESDDFPILRHGFAVPPPLPKEANINSKLSAMGSLEKELSVGLRIDFPEKSTVFFRRLADNPSHTAP